MSKIKITTVLILLAIAIAATAVLVRSRYAGTRQAELSGDERFLSQSAPKPTEGADVSEDEFTDSRSRRPTKPAQHVEVSPAYPVQIQGAEEWAKMFFANEETGVFADRCRFVNIDRFTLDKAIRTSQTYLAAASGRASDDADSSEGPDFEMKLFDDLQLDFKIDEAQIELSEGLERIIVRGHVDRTEDSSFRLTVRNNPYRIVGSIDTPDSHIRIATPTNVQVTVIAEFDRDRIEADMVSID